MGLFHPYTGRKQRYLYGGEIIIIIIIIIHLLSTSRTSQQHSGFLLLDFVVFCDHVRQSLSTGPAHRRQDTVSIWRRQGRHFPRYDPPRRLFRSEVVVEVLPADLLLGGLIISTPYEWSYSPRLITRGPILFAHLAGGKTTQTSNSTDPREGLKNQSQSSWQPCVLEMMCMAIWWISGNGFFPCFFLTFFPCFRSPLGEMGNGLVVGGFSDFSEKTCMKELQSLNIVDEGCI